MDDVVQQSRFPLSLEVRTWFQWRNGPSDVGPGYVALPIGEFFDLSSAISASNRWADQFPPDSPDGLYFPPSWLPLVGSPNHFVAADCNVEFAEPSPVHWFDVPEDNWHTARAPSVLHMVRLWHRMLDEDFWRYDRVEGDWVDTYKDIPREFRITDLV